MTDESTYPVLLVPMTQDTTGESLAAISEALKKFLPGYRVALVGGALGSPTIIHAPGGDDTP